MLIKAFVKGLIFGILFWIVICGIGCMISDWDIVWPLSLIAVVSALLGITISSIMDYKEYGSKPRQTVVALMTEEDSKRNKEYLIALFVVCTFFFMLGLFIWLMLWGV